MASIIETTAVSFRKGSTQENLNFLGVQGEVVVDLGYKSNNVTYGTDSNVTLRVHNGITRAGIPLARADMLNISTEVLAEHRGFLGDKNLAYADLSNLEVLNDASVIANVVNTFNNYGLAKTSYVDSELSKRALKNMSNVDTANLATAGEGHGGKNLAYADTSNVNTSDLADPTIHTGTATTGKPLVYNDLSNVASVGFSSTIADDLVAVLNSHGLAKIDYVDTQINTCEKLANKKQLINFDNTLNLTTDYPSSPAVWNYVETRLEETKEGMLYNDLNNLNGNTDNDKTAAENTLWRINKNDIVPYIENPNTFPESNETAIATIEQVWKAFNSVATTNSEANAFLHKEFTENVLGVKVYKKPIITSINGKYKVNYVGIGNGGTGYDVGNIVSVNGTNGEILFTVLEVTDAGEVVTLSQMSYTCTGNYASSVTTAATSVIIPETGATGSGLTVRYQTINNTNTILAINAQVVEGDQETTFNTYTPVADIRSSTKSVDNTLSMYVYDNNTASFATEDISDKNLIIPAGTKSGLHLHYNSGNPYAVFDKCDLAVSDDSYKVATTKYVQANLAGAVSTIKTNNLTASRAVISNGSGKIAVSDTTSTELGYVHGVTSAIQTQFNNITDLIPTQATTTNQLADKAFVNSTIQTNTANYRGNWATWSDVPTSANSYPEDYTGSKTPTVNDYLVVQDASGYTEETLAGTWRFKYTGVWSTAGKSGWLPEYQVNEEPLTAAQVAAINSGITSVLVTQISTNQTNITNLTNNKQDNITGAATTITSSDLGTNKALISNNDGKVAVSTVTSTELSYLASARSNIQDQIDAIESSGAIDANVLHKTGDETASGIKTFTDGIQIGPADLAERYKADDHYEEGTLVCFGGKEEITKAIVEVNAVVSGNPAILLNSEDEGLPIALAGKVNVLVSGSVRKFEKLKLSNIPGVASVRDTYNDKVIAIALEDNMNEEIKLVKCVTKFEF